MIHNERVTLSLDEIRAVPKVLLHDHLDGGLRTSTIVALAQEIGYDELPSYDPEVLAASMTGAARRGHLELYLEPFKYTVAVMQTREALIRVAAECAEDLAADGIVYAEVRFAPELHLDGGLQPDEVVEAVLEGFRLGSAASGIIVRGLLTGMRTTARSLEIAELAVRYRDLGVVGFDIAGARPAGRPAVTWTPRVRAAGELPHHDPRGGGVRPAVDLGGRPVLRRGTPRARGAARRRHQDRPGRHVIPGQARLLRPGPPDPLEMCPTSNIQTGVADSIAHHPIGLLRDLSFRVTVNTDNRLMSGVTLSSELHALVEAFGYGWADIQWLTINAMKSAFLHFDERLEIINTVIKPAFEVRTA